MSNKILPQKILRFPSGRSVKNCRADAKRLAKQHKHNGMTHAKALDIIANENGCSNGWDKAIRQLTLSAQGISRESKKEQISEQNLFDSLIPKSLQSLLDNISKITEPAKFITRNFDTNNQALNDYEKLLAQVKSPIPAATESMIRQAAEELSKMTMPLAQAIPDYERLVEQWKIPTATQEFMRQAEELSKMTKPLA
ncbi:hypothetical protein OKS80_11890, partial [Aeromonas veronii]|uniref:hypothetical protein n=1 Tax=Aeromonas veronii TaxID=654 RepID=UPI00226CC402